MGQCIGGKKALLSNEAGDQAGPSNAAEIQAGAAAAGNNRRQFSLQEIRDATEIFNERIDTGGSSIVYRGIMNNQDVAVKRLNPGENRNVVFAREVEVLSRLNHPNIIDLIGFCADDADAERILVYKYMPLGCLNDRLRHRGIREKALDWSTRMRIAAGVAKGLNHLHNEAVPRVVFGDLKPADVLLGVRYDPKISDFGVAMNIQPHSPNSIVQIIPSDSQKESPYWALEAVQNGILSPRSDVYSFGVLLLDIITCSDLPNRRHPGFMFFVEFVTNPANYVGLVDRELGKHFPRAEARKAMSLATLCMNNNPTDRPVMSDVVRGMNNLAGEPNAEWPAQFIVAGAV